MKAYVKPELFYERYELSQHIANCDIEVKFADHNSCVGYADDGLGWNAAVFFVKDNVVDCLTDPADAVCYFHSTSGMGNTFQS